MHLLGGGPGDEQADVGPFKCQEILHVGRNYHSINLNPKLCYLLCVCEWVLEYANGRWGVNVS